MIVRLDFSKAEEEQHRQQQQEEESRERHSLHSGSSHTSPRQVLERFFEAERRYMQEAGSFEALRATMAGDVVLHQSPDLPWGGEYAGPKRYEEWARAMSAVFDQVMMMSSFAC